MSTSFFIASGCPIATTSLYRCSHLQEQLRALGYEARVADWFEEGHIQPYEALTHDVIVLYRLPMSSPLHQLIERARELDKPVIFDTDDLVFEPDLLEQHRAVRDLSPADQVQHAEGVRRYLETLMACEQAIAATPLLVEFAQRRGRIAYVHRNSLGHEMLALAEQLQKQRRPEREEVVIGYGSGTATHDVDFAEASGALVQVLKRYPQTQLWIAGPLKLPAALEVFGARVRRFPLTDWRGWFELAGQFDIALAPLERENVFCRAKSEIKFVEAGVLGVPLVASRIDPYEDAITDGEDGLLAGDDAEWMRAVSWLIEEPTRRREIGARARAIVLQRHSPEARTRDLAALLPQLVPSITPARAPAPAQGSIQPGPQRLTINWLIPEPAPGAGGDLGIFRVVRDLAALGHDCQVHVVPYTLMVDFSSEQMREHVRQHFGETRAHYQRWSGHLGNADCSFATFWPTVEKLTGQLKGGRRYYLVQDFEPDFYPGDAHHTRRAENTYRAGLHCITLGRWLTKLLRERYRATADYFDFAVDPQVYWPRKVPRDEIRRVCFYARPTTPRRGYELGLQALELLQARLPQVEIVFYGTENLQPRPVFPFVDRGLLNQEELATLFSSCDVGLVLSLSNPSFVPLEMMACGCAVVEIASERMEGVATHGHDAWLVEPKADAIADGLVRLLEDAALRARLIENARARTSAMSWESSARQIEAVLLGEPSGR